MADAPQPVLAYDRIDANRRKTRLLLVSFAAVGLPVVTGLTVWVGPWIFLFSMAVFQVFGIAIFGTAAMRAWLQSLEADMAPSASGTGPVNLRDVPAWAFLLEGGILALALILAVLALAGITVFLISRYGSRTLLRGARATPVDRDRDRDRELVRVVENLCIGAGLPMPAIHLVESEVPNAFAVGRDPDHASLVVTRGLLTLVDRRELEGVIAHELSHIGNHDIRLSTTLAAMVGTLCVPFGLAVKTFRFVFRLPLILRIPALFMGFQFALAMSVAFVTGLMALGSGELSDIHPLLKWWSAHAMATPLYALFVAPVLALLIRQTVSRQREFLADADAVLLTRDPEGLALALVKVATARGERLQIGEGSVHLYFADPLEGGGSILHTLFPSHPPIEQRIELLARMGSGITPGDLERARGAAVKVVKVPEAAHIEPPIEASFPAFPRFPGPEIDTPGDVPDAPASVTRGVTPLYEQPDGWSRVLRQLPDDAVVRPVGRDGDFVRVLTNDNLVGYVPSSARLPAIEAFTEKGMS